MFGPESGKDSWGGLTFMYEKVRDHGQQRMGNSAMSSEERMDAFLRVWEDEVRALRRGSLHTPLSREIWPCHVHITVPSSLQLPSRGSAGVSTRPARLPHPWAATSIRRGSSTNLIRSSSNMDPHVP